MWPFRVERPIDQFKKNICGGRISNVPAAENGVKSMELIVTKPFQFMGERKFPGERINADGWVASRLLQQGNVKRSASYEIAAIKTQETAVMPARETAAITPPEAAIEPKHLGGGWYELHDGRKCRKAEIEEYLKAGD